MDAAGTGTDTPATGDARPRRVVGGRWPAVVQIAVFDVVGPLVVYRLLVGAGSTAVTALVVSGILPAFGVAITAASRRRLDVIGVLVLAGIVVGTALGLSTRDARLVLIEGSIPTGLFGLACLGSLWVRRPLMFHFAVEFMGPESERGREFAGMWQYPGFRHVFRVMTVVWGVGFLVEAATRVLIVLNTTTGTALAVSKVLPWVFVAVLGAWTAVYGRRQRRKGERLAAAAASPSLVTRHSDS